MYAVKLRFKGKGQTTWQETILRNRFEKEQHAEAFASDMKSRGAKVEVLRVR